MSFDADEVMKLSQEAEAVQTAAAAAEEARAEAATARAKLEQARAELQAAIERVKQAEARAEAASTATDNSRRRDPPGPKPTDDWPEKVKAELLRIALTDPKALHKPNYDALNRQIRKRFGDTNRWLPKDPKETEKIVREFLQRLH
jgi:multidrug efflux pump subunit AcrA (membrane-fusion protein)